MPERQCVQKFGCSRPGLQVAAHWHSTISSPKSAPTWGIGPLSCRSRRLQCGTRQAACILLSFGWNADGTHAGGASPRAKHNRPIGRHGRALLGLATAGKAGGASPCRCLHLQIVFCSSILGNADNNSAGGRQLKCSCLKGDCQQLLAMRHALMRLLQYTAAASGCRCTDGVCFAVMRKEASHRKGCQ